MKEKEYLRPLPFRAHASASRATGGGDEADLRGDEELKHLLRVWEAPPAPDAPDARLLAAYRRQTSERKPSWRRLLTASVRVPVPVAALSVLALLVVAATLAARPGRVMTQTQSTAIAPHARETTKIVEVPVVQERVVTRFVYVEKNGRRAPRGTDENLPERREPERRVRQRQQLASVEREGAREAEAHGTGYFTRVNMEEFQPAQEMKIRMLKKGHGDEK